MTMNELMAQILEILPEAEFMEDKDSGEIVISTGFAEKVHNEPLVKVEGESWD
jgi:hypothetical protein